MTVIIGGSGTANGISSFSSPATFGGTLATASRGISNASVPSGGVLQVINSSFNTYVSIASATIAATGLSATITPLFSTSKVFAIFCMAGISASQASCGAHFELYRGSTSVATGDDIAAWGSTSAISSNLNYLDSPSTTISTTYSVYWKRTGSGTMYLNNYTSGAGSTYSWLTLMEIAQ